MHWLQSVPGPPVPGGERGWVSVQVLQDIHQTLPGRVQGEWVGCVCVCVCVCVGGVGVWVGGWGCVWVGWGSVL